jgi:DNA-binding MarR family transcriptional regulator
MLRRKQKSLRAPTPAELAALIHEFGREYTRWLQGELQQAGTTPARARLLLALQCQGPCRMSDISTLLGVTPRSVTKLVDSLEREGLVLRQPHPEDRRALLLRLTDQGAMVCKESCLANAEATAGLYAELTPTDRSDFARVLQRLLETLQRRRA